MGAYLQQQRGGCEPAPWGWCPACFPRCSPHWVWARGGLRDPTRAPDMTGTGPRGHCNSAWGLRGPHSDQRRPGAGGLCLDTEQRLQHTWAHEAPHQVHGIPAVGLRQRLLHKALPAPTAIRREPCKGSAAWSRMPLCRVPETRGVTIRAAESSIRPQGVVQAQSPTSAGVRGLSLTGAQGTLRDPQYRQASVGFCHKAANGPASAKPAGLCLEVRPSERCMPWKGSGKITAKSFPLVRPLPLSHPPHRAFLQSLPWPPALVMGTDGPGGLTPA